MENQEDVVEAMRLDAVGEMTEQLEGAGVGGVGSIDHEKEDGDDERAGRRGTVPPPYAEISSSFGLLERAAEEGGNGKPSSTWRRPGRRSSKCMRPRQCGRRT